MSNEGKAPSPHPARGPSWPWARAELAGPTQGSGTLQDYGPKATDPPLTTTGPASEDPAQTFHKILGLPRLTSGCPFSFHPMRLFLQFEETEHNGIFHFS